MNLLSYGSKDPDNRVGSVLKKLRIAGLMLTVKCQSRKQSKMKPRLDEMIPVPVAQGKNIKNVVVVKDRAKLADNCVMKISVVFLVLFVAISLPVSADIYKYGPF